MHNDDIPEAFYGNVEKAARDVTSKWPDLEWEDTRQDMWVELVADRPYLGRVATADTPGPMLRKLGSRVVSEQFDNKQLFKGKVAYGTKRVRSMLEAGIIENSEVGTVSESTDLSLAMLDLKKSNPDYFNVIKNRYVEGVVDTAQAVKLLRAVDKLTDLMNIGVAKQPKDHDGPGSRKAMSNEAAQWKTQMETNHLTGWNG